ncbi:MAG TPA: hypothetical protein VLF95_01135, partial [Vicinamibacteria bacterium]|nr:hypothetical protein [Vicinamibacteria bacterium]
MKFGPARLGDAQGKILGHNVAGPDGRRLLRKGRPLSAADIETLRALGRSAVYVFEPGPEDVGEDEAARRVALAAAGPGIDAAAPSAGRANLIARERGVLRLDPERLTALNLSEGVCLSTLPRDAAVSPRQIVATVKVIPYAVASEALARAVGAAAQGGPLLCLDPLPPRRVGLILSGSPAVASRVTRDFDAPLRSRVEALGSSVDWVEFVPLEDEAGEEALAQALRRQA